MRVLGLVTAWARHERDVITPWLEALALHLRAVGVDFEVLAPSWRGSSGGVLNQVRVHRFRYAPAPMEVLSHEASVPDQLRHKPWWAALVPSYLAAAAFETRRLVQRERFDLVHAFWPLPHGLPGFAGGVPMVSSFFGVELTLAEKFRVLRPPLRAIVRSSREVTANSNSTANRLCSLVPGAKPTVIPFGFTVEPVTTPRFAKRSGDFRLLFLGRLVERKGVSTLLAAVASLAGVQVEILGDGPLRAALEKRAPPNVVFRGFVSAEEKANALKSCDALVLPAVIDSLGDTEGQGVVLLEAMAMGKPVVASRAGGIIDLVEDGKTGTLVPPADVAALRRAIEALRDDEALCRELGAAGHLRATAHFSWPGICASMAEVYRRASAR